MKDNFYALVRLVTKVENKEPDSQQVEILYGLNRRDFDGNRWYANWRDLYEFNETDKKLKKKVISWIFKNKE